MSMRWVSRASVEGHQLKSSYSGYVFSMECECGWQHEEVVDGTHVAEGIRAEAAAVERHLREVARQSP